MLFLVTLFFVISCSRFSNIDVPIYVYNRSPWRITLIVDGQKLRTFAPNTTDSFMQQVMAPKNTYNSVEPSNRQTQISYSFLNEGTGIMTETRTCYVGERMKTTITYESAYSGGSSSQVYTNCYSSY